MEQIFRVQHFICEMKWNLLMRRKFVRKLTVTLNDSYARTHTYTLDLFSPFYLCPHVILHQEYKFLIVHT